MSTRTARALPATVGRGQVIWVAGTRVAEATRTRGGDAATAGRRSGAGRLAFTFVEMMTSCAILGLSMVALGYGLKLALVSTGVGASNALASLEAADVVTQVTDDLTEATQFTDRTPEAVTFTVPDREGGDANDEPDKIRYQWWPTGGSYTIPGTSTTTTTTTSGGGGGLLGVVGGLLGGGGGGTTTTTTTSGDVTITVPPYTLTRQVNDGDVALLARDVRQFGLNYLTRSASPPASTAVADRLLWSYEPSVSLASSFGVTASAFVGQTFLPSARLPAGTTTFTVTRVAFALRADSSLDGLLRVSIRPAVTSGSATNHPQASTTIVARTSLSEVSLNGAYHWIEVPFAAPVVLNAATKYSLVIEGVSGTGYHAAVYLDSGAASSTWCVKSSNGGSTWAIDALLTESLRYRVYGTTP